MLLLTIMSICKQVGHYIKTRTGTLLFIHKLFMIFAYQHQRHYIKTNIQISFNIYDQ
jgi:hypothetical protein